MRDDIRRIIEDNNKSDAVWIAVGYTAQSVYNEAVKGMELNRAQELCQRLVKLGYLPGEP